MKAAMVFVGFLLLITGAAQQHDGPRPKGAIYGIAIGQDGYPAKGIELNAEPLGVFVFRNVLPYAKTNDAGEYRFDNLDWGRYTVYAEDERAGYSRISTGPAGDSHPAEVKVTPERPEAEFNVNLPPKAGFLEIHLTNRRTGVDISGMQIAVMRMEDPESPLFTMSCHSNHDVLVQQDKNILLHVTSDGFLEWDESIGRGKPLHLPTGTRLTLAVELEPSD